MDLCLSRFFKSEACVSSWNSLFLVLVTYDYQSIPAPDLPESLVLHISSHVLLQHFICMTHPSPYFYHCPCNPFPTSLLESSFRNTKYITPVPSCMAPLPSHIALKQLQPRQLSLHLPPQWITSALQDFATLDTFLGMSFTSYYLGNYT